VIARAGGSPLPVLVQQIVTQPLAMTDTSFVVTDRERLASPYATSKPAPVRMTEPFDLPPKGSVRFSPARIFDPASFPSGGAGLAGTARDYLLFAEALRTGGAPMVKPETARAMTENQIGTIHAGDGEIIGFGLGVVSDPVAARTVRSRGSFGWGGIYGTGFWVDPGARMSVVILTNVAGGTPLEGELEAAIYAAP
jgi:CubicO group peptidase (beta-lactamase class C family)